jgi:hypothetical protein
MMRSGIGEAAARERDQRTTSEQSAHESSP